MSRTYVNDAEAIAVLQNVKEWCSSLKRCKGCPFCDETYMECVLHTLPDQWALEQVKEHKGDE